MSLHIESRYFSLLWTHVLENNIKFSFSRLSVCRRMSSRRNFKIALQTIKLGLAEYVCLLHPIYISYLWNSPININVMVLRWSNRPLLIYENRTFFFFFGRLGNHVHLSVILIFISYFKNNKNKNKEKSLCIWSFATRK